MPFVEVFVNHDDDGDGVCLLLDGAEVIELDGELYPVIEVTPGYAGSLAKALVACAKQIEDSINPPEGTSPE
jgi:hypothetical protein